MYLGLYVEVCRHKCWCQLRAKVTGALELQVCLGDQMPPDMSARNLTLVLSKSPAFLRDQGLLHSELFHSFNHHTNLDDWMTYCCNPKLSFILKSLEYEKVPRSRV